MIRINLNLLENIKKCDVADLFGLNFKQEEWIWINNEVFLDLILNVIDYDTHGETEIIKQLNNISEEVFVNILKDKFKEVSWVEVNQRLFEKLEEGFKATEDIKTYIFADKKYYMIKMITEMKLFQWMLKAMAVDVYQHLTPERQLKNVYEEDFQDNFMILEEIIGNGLYEKNNCTWKVAHSTQTLVFYKNGKQYRVWAEGNANFIYTELSK